MGSLENYVQSASSVLLDGLKYDTPPSANYIIDRRSVQYTTSSAGTFTAQGVRNFSINMTSESGHFADLHTCRLAFRIKKNRHWTTDSPIHRRVVPVPRLEARYIA